MSTISSLKVYLQVATLSRVRSVDHEFLQVSGATLIAPSTAERFCAMSWQVKSWLTQTSLTQQ